MITRVAIDSQALLDHKDRTRAAVNTHRSLVQILESYGFIELLGVADSTALVKAIKGLPEEMGELWEKAIVGLMDLNRVCVGSSDKTAGDLCAEEPLPELLRSLADLVVISERASSDRQAIRTNGFEMRGGQPELTLADSITHCQTIKRVRSLRELGNYRETTRRDVIWDDVFDTPARLSNEATLLDQHFLKHLFLGRSRKAWNHVEWLIRMLDGSMVAGSTLRLLCGLPSAGSPPSPFPRSRLESAIQKHIAPILGSGHLAKIELVLAPWPRRYESGPHNRHLRFSTGLAISTDEGFDRLDNHEVRGIDGFSWRGITSAALLGDLATRESVIYNHPDRIELQA